MTSKMTTYSLNTMGYSTARLAPCEPLLLFSWSGLWYEIHRMIAAVYRRNVGCCAAT